jgi:acyl carrier protein
LIKLLFLPRKVTLGEAYIAPRTPTEEFLAEIWAEVLELDRVGVHDNFFEFGGHSLLTMKIVAKIFERTQINLPLWTVLEAPSVASMATYLAEMGARSDDEVPAWRNGRLRLSKNFPRICRQSYRRSRRSRSA